MIPPLVTKSRHSTAWAHYHLHLAVAHPDKATRNPSACAVCTAHIEVIVALTRLITAETA